MENILNLYEQPYDPKRPLICFDERPCQLIEDVLVPLPMEPGKPKRQDYQYKRNGVCTVLMAFEPATGWRFVQVRSRRTKKDYAEFMHALAQQFPHRHAGLFRTKLPIHLASVVGVRSATRPTERLGRATICRNGQN